MCLIWSLTWSVVVLKVRIHMIFGKQKWNCYSKKRLIAICDYFRTEADGKELDPEQSVRSMTSQVL